MTVEPTIGQDSRQLALLLEGYMTVDSTLEQASRQLAQLMHRLHDSRHYSLTRFITVDTTLGQDS